MSDAAFRNRFVALYPRLRAQLTRRLGSVDAAEEALNEAFLKLSRPREATAISNVQGYFYRTALNAAADQQRAGARLASASEIDDALAIPDGLPDPHRSLEGIAAIERLAKAMEAMTPRRRAILEAVRIHGNSCKQVALDMGLSRRTVETELRHALEHCSEYMRKGGFDYAIPREETSVQ